MQTISSITLSFYGINIQFNSQNGKMIEEIGRDFSFFKSASITPHITINAHNQPPPYDTLPPMQASYVSPRNICYYHKGAKYIDYPGRGLTIYKKAESLCEIYSNDCLLLHQICYMAIISLVSEQLDKHHMHRVHGLGLTGNGKGILLLLEMGGGKTTLAVSLLSSKNNVKLIPEDSPLIDRQGRLLPFPIRIGMHPADVPAQIPEEYRRYFERDEFGPKILIDTDYFKDRICTAPCDPGIIIIGKRVIGKPPEIKPASKSAALKELIKNSVIGLGLYQGIEYLFQKSPAELFTKLPLGLSRLNNGIKLINKCRAFEFSLSPDQKGNSRVLGQFIESI